MDYPHKQLVIGLTVFIFILLTGLNTNQTATSKNITEVLFSGCTPGDQYIKSVFGIPDETKIDFIRWNLTLKSQNTYLLNIVFGVSKPNTLGFVDGGEKIALEGEYFISENINDNIKRTIYQFSNSKSNTGLKMLKINDNLMHLLSTENELVVGNGGWSYTLNRKEPVRTFELPSLTSSALLLKASATQTIYLGRTPCTEVAGEANMNVPTECFKLKWKLTLNRDPVTFTPTTYQLLRPPYRQSEIKGTWSIVKGSPSNVDAIIYKLDPPEQEKSIFLFVADENIIYFLDKNNHLYTGNQDFSYTLNRLSN